jgi:hypothetical protein
MKKKPFQQIKNATPPQPRQVTQRDLDIMVDQIAIMTRQNGDMATQLAQAEAINRRLAAEYSALKAEYDSLASKGKKG